MMDPLDEIKWLDHLLTKRDEEIAKLCSLVKAYSIAVGEESLEAWEVLIKRVRELS